MYSTNPHLGNNQYKIATTTPSPHTGVIFSISRAQHSIGRLGFLSRPRRNFDRCVQHTKLNSQIQFLASPRP